MARKKRAEKIESRIAAYVPTLLDRTAVGKQVLNIPKGNKIFSQGDAADAIFFIQSGKVKISVVSLGGREAVLSVLGPPNSSAKVPWWGSLFE